MAFPSLHSRALSASLLLTISACSTSAHDDDSSETSEGDSASESQSTDTGDTQTSGTSNTTGDGDSGDGDSGDGDSGDGDSGDGDSGDGDSGDGDSGDGDSGDGDSGDGDGDGEAGPTPPPEFTTLIAPAPGGGTISVGHCAIAPDGDIYAIWQQDVGGSQDIWMRRSSDGGQSFEAAIPIENGSLTPLGGWGAADRKPYVATDGNRVAVSFGTYPNGSSYVGISSSLSPLTMNANVEVGSPDTSDVEEFQKPIFSPNGDVWVAWHWTHEEPLTEDISLSREENGWAYEVLPTSANGVPCDCCPLDIQTTDGGDFLVAYRNNIGNIRDHYVMRGPGGSNFSDPIQGSSTNWQTFACPTSGPRLSHTPNNGALMTWADPTSGAPRVWMAHSADGGASWSQDHLIANNIEGVQQLPSIVTAQDGRVWVSFNIAGEASHITSSTDEGYSFTSSITLPTADGELVALELCSGGERAGAVGTSPAGSLWWTELPVQ